MDSKLKKIYIKGVESFKKEKINHLNYYVYQLWDPITQEVCYIGKTYSPVTRIKYYCNPYTIHNNNWRLMSWLNYLIDTSQEPIMVLYLHLEGYMASKEIEKIEAKEIKIKWDEGHPLLNRKGLIKKPGRIDRITNAEFWKHVQDHNQKVRNSGRINYLKFFR